MKSENSKHEDLVTQADFAKIIGVSRQSVTNWKRRGSLVLVDDLVDVAASRAKLAKSTTYLGEARRGAARGAKLPSPDTTVARPGADHNPGSGHAEDGALSCGGSIDIPERLPVHFINNAESAAWLIAMVLLNNSSIEYVRFTVMKLLLPAFYQNAFQSLDFLGIKPPQGFSNWREVEMAPPFFWKIGKKWAGRRRKSTMTTGAKHERGTRRPGGWCRWRCGRRGQHDPSRGRSGRRRRCRQTRSRRGVGG